MRSLKEYILESNSSYVFVRFNVSGANITDDEMNAINSVCNSNDIYIEHIDSNTFKVKVYTDPSKQDKNGKLVEVLSGIYDSHMSSSDASDDEKAALASLGKAINKIDAIINDEEDEDEPEEKDNKEDNKEDKKEEE